MSLIILYWYFDCNEVKDIVFYWGLWKVKFLLGVWRNDDIVGYFDKVW